MTETTSAALDKLTTQAGQLYSLPSVALEVLRLTESDSVDIRQLTETIERDPALCVKLLRVVNSSLFGLSGEVADLNQALALLGVEPLKMLVLGFSLPDEIFASLAADQLRRYWTVSLTRAVCARAIASRFPTVSGDQAFLAGLLQDIGQLVMMQQLGEPYVKFLETAGEHPGRLCELEEQSLGFDHTRLSSELLSQWGLPAKLTTAVRRAPGERPRHEMTQLEQVVMLAERMTTLVLDKRLDVLPDLLAFGEQVCGLTRENLGVLLEPLQERVDQLAKAMAVELSEGIDHQAVIADAHALLAVTADNAIGMIIAAKTDDELAEGLLVESHEVRLAMREFLRSDSPVDKTLIRSEVAHASAPKTRKTTTVAELEEPARERLLTATGKLTARCRAERVELSLVLLRVGLAGRMNKLAKEQNIKGVLADAQLQSPVEQAAMLPLNDAHIALLMPGVDRREAVSHATAAVDAAAVSDCLRMKAGVATITQTPNRFDPARLVDGALGCLNAALAAGSTSVKSIEVY